MSEYCILNDDTKVAEPGKDNNIIGSYSAQKVYSFVGKPGKDNNIIGSYSAQKVYSFVGKKLRYEKHPQKEHVKKSQDKTIKKINAISNVFDFNDIKKFIDVILYKLQVEAHYSKTYFYICQYKQVRFLVKMGFHVKNSPELYNSTGYGELHGQDAEIKILYVLKELIPEITPCIVDIVFSISGKANKLIKNPKKQCHNVNGSLGAPNAGTEREIYINICIFQKMVRAGLAYNKISFVILERCDISFHRLLVENYNSEIVLEIIRSILFQIIYTLYAIKKKYPTFRHYDLHSSNIMIKYSPDFRYTIEYQAIIYNVNGSSFAIPYLGMLPKLIDFGFSSISELGINNSILSDKYLKLYRSNNDLLHLFHDIYLIDNRYYNILHTLDPKDSFIHYDVDKINVTYKDDYYEKALHSSLFTEYMDNSKRRNEMHIVGEFST